MAINFHEFSLQYLESFTGELQEKEQRRIEKYHEGKLLQGAEAWNAWQKEIKEFIDDNRKIDLIENINVIMGHSKVSYTESDFLISFVDIDIFDLNGFDFIIPVKFVCNHFKDAIIINSKDINSLVFDSVIFEENFSFEGDLTKICFKGETSFNKNVDFLNPSTGYQNIFYCGRVVFGGYVKFENTGLFREELINTDGLLVNFKNTVFHGDIIFNSVNIAHIDLGGVLLEESVAYLSFRKSLFENDVSFDSKVFNFPVDFSDSVFNGDASFNNVIFNGDVKFTRTEFKKNAYFNKKNKIAKEKFNPGFHKKALFNKAIFHNRAYFHNQFFSGEVTFKLSDIHTLILDGSRFEKQVPDFRYAEIKNPPSLSDIRIPGFLDENRHNVERYRKLKEMAIGASNYKKEIEFFSFELDAERSRLLQVTKDKIAENKKLCPLEGGWEYLKILPYYIYKFFSNYGQSISKPSFYLIVIWIFFGFSIFLVTPDEIEHSDALSQAKRASVLQLNRSYDCSPLHKNPGKKLGYSMHYAAQVLYPIQLGTDQEREKVVFCLLHDEVPSFGLKFAEAFIKALGLILFFLLGLGIRNRFKIK